MVTPYITSTDAIVCLLWVTIMNCELSENLRIICVNLPTLASSSGASTSSSIQNGAGLIRYMANRNAVDVSVFSPPDNCVSVLGFLPLGCAYISMLLSARFSGSVRRRSQLSSAVNSALNTCTKFSRTILNVSLNFDWQYFPLPLS